MRQPLTEVETAALLAQAHARQESQMLQRRLYAIDRALVEGRVDDARAIAAQDHRLDWQR